MGSPSATVVATTERITDTLFRRLVEEGPGAVYLCEATVAPAWIKYVSPQIERMLGYPESAWTGDPRFWLERVHPDDRGWLEQASIAGIRDGHSLDLEYRLVHADGSTVWVHDTVATIRDADGTPVARQGLLVDITARHQAEERLAVAEARYRSLVERLPIATYIEEGIHPDTSRYVSPGIERMTGYPVEDWTADPYLWERILHPDDLERVLGEWRRVTEERATTWSSDYRMIHRDGREVWVRDLGELRYDAEQVLVEGVLVDITDRMRAEEDLAAANEDLRAVDRGRSEFFTRASHELRTPLTSMLGYLDILDRQWEELTDPDRREHVATVQRQALRLTRLVRDLLATAEMDQGLLSIDRRPTELREIVEAVVRHLAPAPETVQVAVEGRPVVLGDRSRLEQIVSNLVANAIRYGASPIRIAVSNGGPTVSVSVSDAGTGVPTDLADHLFERFALSDETERRIQQGFGLGLSVARDLARAQGGDLRYVGGPDGAEFVLTLPSAASHA
jgi:PAS domain S-box-containing protein